MAKKKEKINYRKYIFRFIFIVLIICMIIENCDFWKGAQTITINDCDGDTFVDSHACNEIGEYKCQTDDCLGVTSYTRTNYIVIYDGDYLLYNYVTEETLEIGPVTSVVNFNDDIYMSLDVIADNNKIYGYLVDTEDTGIQDYYSYETGELLYENRSRNENFRYHFSTTLADSSNIDDITDSSKYLLVSYSGREDSTEITELINLITGEVEYVYDDDLDLDM